MRDNSANPWIYQPGRECAATWVCKRDICPGYFLRVLRGTWTQKSKNQTDLIPDSCPRVAMWHQTLWFVATCAKLDIWNYILGEIHCLSWSGSLCISALNWHPCNVRRIWRDYAIFSPNRLTYACVSFPVLKWDVQRWLIYTLYFLFISRLECFLDYVFISSPEPLCVSLSLSSSITCLLA